MTAAARSTGTCLTGPSPAGKANGRGPRAPPRTRRRRPRTRPAVVGETMELSRRAPETESSRIAACVRFHLFRSKSEWVMREVHLALARKQGDDTASSKGLRSCPRRRSSPAAFQRPHRLPAGGSCAVTMVGAGCAAACGTRSRVCVTCTTATADGAADSPGFARAQTAFTAPLVRLRRRGVVRRHGGVCRECFRLRPGRRRRRPAFRSKGNT